MNRKINLCDILSLKLKYHMQIIHFIVDQGVQSAVCSLGDREIYEILRIFICCGYFYNSARDYLVR